MTYDTINIDGKAGGLLMVGGAPQPKDRMQDWAHTLVLCAQEYQPGVGDLEFEDMEVLRVPLGDVDEPQNPRDIATMFAISQKVAKQLQEGKTVVVTCVAGLNRSCLIAGMAMRMIGVSGDQTVHNLKAARGDRGLCNETFEKLVRATIPVMV